VNRRCDRERLPGRGRVIGSAWLGGDATSGLVPVPAGCGTRLAGRWVLPA